MGIDHADDAGLMMPAWTTFIIVVDELMMSRGHAPILHVHRAVISELELMTCFDVCLFQVVKLIRNAFPILEQRFDSLRLPLGKVREVGINRMLNPLIFYLALAQTVIPTSYFLFIMLVAYHKN